MPEDGEFPEDGEAWRAEVLTLLRGILACVERLAASQELSVFQEPQAASQELPEGNESFPTWILTDAAVARLEEAVVAEQRLRGQAYGGALPERG